MVLSKCLFFWSTQILLLREGKEIPPELEEKLQPKKAPPKAASPPPKAEDDVQQLTEKVRYILYLHIHVHYSQRKLRPRQPVPLPRQRIMYNSSLKRWGIYCTYIYMYITAKESPTQGSQSPSQGRGRCTTAHWKGAVYIIINVVIYMYLVCLPVHLCCLRFICHISGIFRVG